MTEDLTTTNAISAEKKALYRRMYAPTATDGEFETFISLAQTYDLRPELHEIWCIKFGNAPAQIFAGRDGIRSVAQRNDMLEGTRFENKFDEKGNIVSSTCYVSKKGCPPDSFSITVYFNEYNQKRNLWLTKPVTMLQKVAECQCLRMAFNINGLYDESEFPDQPTKYNSDGAIDVVPEVKIETYDKYTAQKVLENMTEKGMNIDVFEKARLPSGEYDKKMIDDDFKKQLSERAAAAKKPEVKPEEKKANDKTTTGTIDDYTVVILKCESCGKEINSAEANASQMFAGKNLCPKCLNKTH